MRKLFIIFVVVAVLLSGILSTANVRASGNATGTFPDRVFNVVKAKGSPASSEFVASIPATPDAGTWSVTLDTLAGSSVTVEVYRLALGTSTLVQSAKLRTPGTSSPGLSLLASTPYEAHFIPSGKAGTSVLTEHFVPAVVNQPPVLTAVAASAESVEVGQSVTFAASATDPDGDTLSFSWDFGDDATATGAVVSHAYALPGHFIATVTVDDGHGASVAGEANLVFIKVRPSLVSAPASPGQTGPVVAVLASSAAVVAPYTAVRFSANASWYYAWFGYDATDPYGAYGAVSLAVDMGFSPTLTYSWGDASPGTLGDPWTVGETAHTFVTSGSHLVVLTVSVNGPTGAASGRAGYTVRTTAGSIADPVKYPSVFTKAEMAEPMYLDPAVDYESAGGGIIQNAYETLVWYPEGTADTRDLVPRLATAVPTLANGGISPDGRDYTFTIRSGVTFQDGTPMTAQDVVYSIRRVLAIHDVDGPSWMLEQVLTNYVAYYVDPYGALTIANWMWSGFGSAADVPANILALLPPESEWSTTLMTAELAWEVSNSSVELASPDTVVFHLTRAYAPFLQTLAFTVGSVVSEAYVEAHGGVAWGQYNTWMNTHAMGTGPFQLVSWYPNEGLVLQRYDGYWRGPAAVREVDLDTVQDAVARELLLQAGDADTIDADWTMAPAVTDAYGNPAYPSLRIVKDMPTFLTNAMGFNQNVNPDYAPLPLTVPADFFADVHVRKAFSYAFDYDAFISNAMFGGATRLNGVIPFGMFGYNDSLTPFPFDVNAAKAELELAVNPATGHSYFADGFEITLYYNAGNFARLFQMLLLQQGLEALNGLGSGPITVNVYALDWPVYLSANMHRGLPIVFCGWFADYADPEDYVVPFVQSYGAFSARIGYSNPTVDEMATAAAAELDPVVREQTYRDLSGIVSTEDVPYVWVCQVTGFHLERTWVSGYYFNPMVQDLDWYPLAKA